MRRPPRPHGPVLDVALAIVFCVSAVVDNAGHPWSTAAATVWMASVALRSVEPTAMVPVMTAGLLAYALSPERQDSEPFLGSLVLMFAVGYQLTGRRRWISLGVLVTAAYVLQIRVTDLDVANTMVTPLLLVGGPAFAGALLRRSRDQTAELRVLGEQLAAERDARARAAVREERSRLARDVHDIVSHSVSLMVVQAGAAEQMLAPGSPALPEVQALRRTGKQALAELRRQLDLLRAEPPAGPA